MKKIFYILAAAIVALGTVACENEGLDNINPNINVDGDTVSFVAGINRTDLDGTATVWDADDTIVVTWNGNNYEFKNAETGDKNTFKCKAEGLSAIVNAENIKAVYSNNKDGKVDSAAGVAGALLEYEGAFGNIAFEVKNAFLKFKANKGSEVKFTASEEIFSTGTELTLTATGEDQYVAVIPKTTTITYALDGVVCTTSEKNTLKACKIYPLSTLDKVVVIKTKEDFLTFAEAVNNGTSYEGYTVKLNNNIDLDGAEWTPVGQTGATQFHGTFDGQGHTIKGLTINAPESYSTNYATGMFGWVETGAVIKNIVLDEANINGYHYVGAIAGYMSGSAKIEGCKVINSEIVADPTKKDTAGEFNGDKVGGIVGYTNGSNVISGNEVSKTTIKGYRHMGGIVGYLLGTAENNTVDDTVVITVNNDNNYKNYAIQSNYGVNNIAGVVTGSATNNNGEVTIVWGDIPATLVNYVAQVGEDKYETIKDAIAAANAAGASEIVIIDNVDLAEDSLSGFAGTIKGGEDVVLDFSNFPAASNYAFPISGTTTFKNITFKFPAGSSSYLSAGLVGEGEFTFENCAFEGCFTINGKAEWAFNNCEFTNNEYYASFVYAAKEVVFTECSFSGKDRAAKIYGDGGDLYVEYHNCEFTSTTTNKAAIAIDATSANTIVIVDECSQTNMNGLYSLDGTKGVVNPVAKDNNGKLYSSFEAALEASSAIELLADIESEDIIIINKNITIDGKGKTIESTATRAINIATEGEVTIKNLIVEATGERAVNVITYPATVKLEGVDLTAANYTVNVATSAGAAKVDIRNSTLHGLNTVNINGAGAVITIDGCDIYCDDNNTTQGEDYAALSLGKDAVGGSIAATNSNIYVTEDSDSTKGCNNASDGTVTIDGSTDGVVVKYAAIIYGDYYYSFDTVDEAIEYDATKTIILLRDATIGTEGTYTIDVNGHELSAAENFILTDNLNGTYTVAKAFVAEKSEYGVVGSFQGWDVAVGKPVAMYTTPEEGWFVAKGVELYKIDEFKFVKGATWTGSLGIQTAGAAALDKEHAVVVDGQNIKAAKNGKFDIYLNPTTKKFKYTCVEEYTGGTVKITIDNKANWSPLYITLKSGDTTIVDKATVSNNVYSISMDYIGESLSYILSNGTKTMEGNVSITKEGATINLEETIILLKVQLNTANAKQWWGNTMKIHVWNTGTSLDTTWPGTEMKNEGNYTWSIQIPSELVGKTINYLVNNGGNWKSNDSKVTIKAEGNTVTGSSIGIN